MKQVFKHYDHTTVCAELLTMINNTNDQATKEHLWELYAISSKKRSI